VTKAVVSFETLQSL